MQNIWIFVTINNLCVFFISTSRTFPSKHSAHQQLESGLLLVNGAIPGGWPLNKHIRWFINLPTSTDLTAWCEMQVKIYLQIISEVNSECPGFVNADLKAIRRIINVMKQSEKLRDELGSVR